MGSAVGPEITGLAAGEQREMTVTLPPCRLSPGSYHCGVSIGRGDRFNGFTNFDIVTDTLFFEVMPEANEFGVLGTWHPSWGTIDFGSLCTAWEQPVSVLSAAEQGVS